MQLSKMCEEVLAKQSLLEQVSLPNPKMGCLTLDAIDWIHFRKGSTSFGACEVRCWRWLFGNKMPVSPTLDAFYRYP